ncbi:MAG: beta-galactosidase trimerization domain-containing protein, partial [Rubrobacteraceae bacterium]
TSEGKAYDCDLWADLIEAEGAETLATYETDFYAGTPAATRHEYENGTAYYLGTRAGETYTTQLLLQACREVGVKPTLQAPPGVEVVRRRTGASSFLFILNHNLEEVTLPVEAGAQNLLNGSCLHAHLSLEPLGVYILEETSG